MKYLKKDETCLYAMGKEAHHVTGEISREEWDLIQINAEDDKNYIGNWMYGFGFIEVKFPKKSIRALNKKEIKYYEGSHYGIGGSYLGDLEIEGRLWKKP